MWRPVSPGDRRASPGGHLSLASGRGDHGSDLAARGVPRPGGDSWFEGSSLPRSAAMDPLPSLCGDVGGKSQAASLWGRAWGAALGAHSAPFLQESRRQSPPRGGAAPGVPDQPPVAAVTGAGPARARPAPARPPGPAHPALAVPSCRPRETRRPCRRRRSCSWPWPCRSRRPRRRRGW